MAWFKRHIDTICIILVILYGTWTSNIHLRGIDSELFDIKRKISSLETSARTLRVILLDQEELKDSMKKNFKSLAEELKERDHETRRSF